MPGGAYASFEDFIRRTYTTRGFGAFDSKGNPTLNAMVKNITLLKKASTFNATLITDLDANQQIITDKSALTLAGILKLTIA